jgi:asparagine synthase (glutamine-hydrolysing)
VGPGLWRNVRRLPRGLRRSLAAGLDAGGARLLSRAYSLAAPLLPASRRQVTVLDKVQKVAQALAAPDRAAFHRALASYWNAPELVALRPDPPAGEPGHLARTRFARPWPELEGLDFASWMMAMDQLTYLPDDGLTKVDRASMAVALEARVPLLDHRVVEFAWRLPLEHKIRGGTGKQVLRRVLANHLPPEMMERPKRGFSVPLGAWLRGPLREWADELLAPETLRDQDFLAPLPVRQAWDEHQAGAANRQYHLWSVLMFQAWLASGQAGGAA